MHACMHARLVRGGQRDDVRIHIQVAHGAVSKSFTSCTLPDARPPTRSCAQSMPPPAPPASAARLMHVHGRLPFTSTTRAPPFIDVPFVTGRLFAMLCKGYVCMHAFFCGCNDPHALLRASDLQDKDFNGCERCPHLMRSAASRSVNSERRYAASDAPTAECFRLSVKRCFCASIAAT